MEAEFIQEILKTFGGEGVLLPALIFIYHKWQNLRIEKAKFEAENKYLKNEIERLK